MLSQTNYLNNSDTLYSLFHLGADDVTVENLDQILKTILELEGVPESDLFSIISTTSNIK